MWRTSAWSEAVMIWYPAVVLLCAFHFLDFLYQVIPRKRDARTDFRLDPSAPPSSIVGRGRRWDRHSTPGCN